MRHLPRIAIVTVLFVAAAMVVACGKSNPAAATTPTSSASGATIRGTVLGGSVSARSADSTGGGMTVSVVGTNITVSVSLTGQFTITGVPAGDIKLKFHGVSGDAEITVTQVTQGETITLTITIQGTVATTETEVREDGQQNTVQVEGRIEGTSAVGVTPKTITVAGKTITAASDTIPILHGNTPYTFADLLPGWRVHVAGNPGTSVNSVIANRIEVQNTNGNIQVTANGIVQEYGTSILPAETLTLKTFTVDGRLVATNADTVTSGKGTLGNGVRVEVKGQQKNGYVLATSIHVN